MPGVCAGPEFAVADGELTLSRVGVFRRVARTYQTAVGDGPFGSLPSPGRTHVDIEVTWVNDTGLPQFVVIDAERGPWLIVVANTNQCFMRDRLTWQVGVGARAADPSTSSVFDGEFASYSYAGAQWFPPPSVNEVPLTSYGAQDRGRLIGGTAVAAVGDTVSARYRCTLHTVTPFKSVLGPENYDGRARFGIVRILAAPART